MAFVLRYSVLLGHKSACYLPPNTSDYSPLPASLPLLLQDHVQALLADQDCHDDDYRYKQNNFIFLKLKHMINKFALFFDLVLAAVVAL